MNYYDMLNYQTKNPIGKNNWLGNIRWFFQETDALNHYAFSTIPSVKEDGQFVGGVCGSYDMKRILFGIEFLCEAQENYCYGADYLKTPVYKLSMPFTEYGTIIKSDCDIKIKTSDFSGRLTGKSNEIRIEETGQMLIVSDDNYSMAFCHNGVAIRENHGFTICKQGGTILLSATFHMNALNACEQAERLYQDEKKVLRTSRDFWEEYLGSCPIYELKEDYNYHNDYLNREEIYKPEDLKIRQLWHYWCTLINVSEIEFNKFPIYIAPDKTNWKGTWSNDGPECLSLLSLTSQKDLAKRCIIDYISAAISKEGVHSWYLHPDGTGCYGQVGDSGIYSNGVPIIVHTVDFYIRASGDKTILSASAGDGMSVYEKLKNYITNLHKLRDIDNDNLIEWVNLWETGWDDKLGVFFEKASIGQWIEIIMSGNKDKINEFYAQNSCPVTSIVEQVYTIWALRSFRNIAIIADDIKTVEYCSKKAEQMILAVKEKCWSEEDRFYYDIDVNSGNLSKSKNADAFYFLSFEDDNSRREALLAHLNNKNEFNLCYIPMASLDSKGFNDSGYWNGGHWPREMSYIAFGLNRCYYKEKAKELCIRALMSEKGNIIPEVINPLTGIKSTNPTKLCYTGLNIVALLDMDEKTEWSN